MSHLFASLRATGSVSAPTCRTCLRLAALPFPSTTSPSAQQTRGKKKKPVRDPKQITVKLEVDTPGVGRKGAFVPTTRGEMRNAWFAAGTASYVPLAEQQALRRARVPIERDVLFLADQGRLSKRKQAEINRAVRAGGQITAVEEVAEEEEKVEVRRIEPRRALDLIGLLVPGKLTFERQVQSEESGALFGSVTAADVAAAVTEALAGNEEASRIVVAEEDVRIVDGAEAGNRIKALGRYDVEISVKGTEGKVERTVRVVAQDKAVAN